MPRGETERVTGLKQRSARMVLADLVKDRIVNSQPPKGPVSLRFTSRSIACCSPSYLPRADAVGLLRRIQFAGFQSALAMTAPGCAMSFDGLWLF